MGSLQKDSRKIVGSKQRSGKIQVVSTISLNDKILNIYEEDLFLAKDLEEILEYKSLKSYINDNLEKGPESLTKKNPKAILFLTVAGVKKLLECIAAKTKPKYENLDILIEFADNLKNMYDVDCDLGLSEEVIEKLETEKELKRLKFELVKKPKGAVYIVRDEATNLFKLERIKDMNSLYDKIESVEHIRQCTDPKFTETFIRRNIEIYKDKDDGELYDIHIERLVQLIDIAILVTDGLENVYQLSFHETGLFSEEYQKFIEQLNEINVPIKKIKKNVINESLKFKVGQLKRTVLANAETPKKRSESLAKLTTKIKKAKRQGDLSAELINELESIEGWTWEASDEWFDKYKLFVEYLTEHNCLPASSEVGNWWRYQKQRRAKDKLPNDQFRSIEEACKRANVKINWGKQEEWRNNLELFREYVEAKKEDPKTSMDSKLDNWINGQRKHFKTGAFLEEKCKLLDSCDKNWIPVKDRRFVDLVKNRKMFFDDNGRFPTEEEDPFLYQVKQRIHNGVEYGDWQLHLLSVSLGKDWMDKLKDD